jgi:hypothetical protein
VANAKAPFGGAKHVLNYLPPTPIEWTSPTVASRRLKMTYLLPLPVLLAQLKIG